MRPQPPSCGNRPPYCMRGGQPMKCIQENEQEWVFQCPACGQVNVLTRPEYKRMLRDQVRRERAINALR
jgi:predicted RNA-binding Zn-ribbon protein involved in translation (DUF1610 family)